MDFYRIALQETKNAGLLVKPDWRVGRSKDLMTRGGAFYAVWDEEAGLWSTDIYDVQRLVDADLIRYAKEQEEILGVGINVAKLESNATKLWSGFREFLRNSGDNAHSLDSKLVFANDPVKKEDYASKRLPYSLVKGPHDAWDTMVDVLYNEEERAKIEWAIGAVISGDSKVIQKFLVFYGPPGSGKSTIVNIIQKLFDGYTGVFDARELASSNNAFATAAFKSNPLVAIQHDGDLSRIFDNTKLNSIVAHEILPINEKYKAVFLTRSYAFLFMCTNVPVKITDAKSGIIRRLIDVIPTQQTIEIETYHELMHKIEFELGAIAQHCLDRYLSMGKNFYNAYRPVEMMLQTDVFYNFVEHYYDVFRIEDGISLKRAWDLYKAWCIETGIDKMVPQYKFREELRNYYDKFEERANIDGKIVRSWFSGFKQLAPATEFPIKPDGVYEIVLEERPSVLDETYPGLPAQYANKHDVPAKPWDEVTTTLGDLDTSRLHFVRLPETHIVIDFDLVDEKGEKNLDLCLEQASKWGPTYAEVSRGGKGLHLHYFWTGGDPAELASAWGPGIEVKTLLGKESLRRKLTKCNNMTIASLNSGLPKKEKPLIESSSVKSEKGLRELIARNLRKEIHPGTKPSIDFIKHILDEAYESNLPYDVTDMRKPITTFAFKSSNQSATCLKTVEQMKFVGKTEMPAHQEDETPMIIFDVEVFPNLFVVCWKVFRKSRDSSTVVRMVNPEPKDIEPLLSMKLVGFNNRRYDNHMLYARYMGYSLMDLFRLSQKIIVERQTSRDNYFGEAYNLSYADIFDFASEKKSLGLFMIELGMHPKHLDLPWGEPVPEKLWDMVVDYCVRDVLGQEAVLEARWQDFVARQVIAEMSGLTVNHTTQQHTARIVFGDERNPQSVFTYFDLAEEFPGYKFSGKESTYRGEVTGEGGYVYAEPGVYENVAVLDVSSMHPTTIKVLNLFGSYTDRYTMLMDARLAIKKGDYEKARQLLGPKVAKHLTDEQNAKALSEALKIVINSVYGLTSASFPNPFRDGRNRDNIVAKRGALFMIDLKHEVQDMGFAVCHIKTDSIKIPNATPEIINFVMLFGEHLGYHFEHEITYDWFCLVNKAVYIAKAGDKWTAVGAQFQHPYVFKTLFSKEELTFDDFCEIKSVKGASIYLDFSGTEAEDVSQMVHIGSVGSFVPVDRDGGTLWRIDGDKKHAVADTKGLMWITRDMALSRSDQGEFNVDMSYFERLKQKAVDAITEVDGVSGIDGLNAIK